jgi:Fe-S-cluster containining protein
MSYLEVLGDLDCWFDAGVAQAGAGVVLCARGCSACCNGPIDISPADAQLVAAAVARLDPATRSGIASRAATQVAMYARLLPEWGEPWDVDAIDDTAFDNLSDALANVPCPALSANGECLVYLDRPATCRMTGLAMRTRELDVLENVCPILHTSEAFARLEPTEFDLAGFERSADEHDRLAIGADWSRTTVAGAVQRGARRTPTDG